MANTKISEVGILVDRGFVPVSDLNYCTENGTEYYIGVNDKEAGIVAMIQDENLYLLTKEDMREMAETARTKGIDKVTLYTNYGVEIHSRHETPKIVNLNRIIKINSEGFNY